MIELPPKARQFLNLSKDAIYTVLPNGFGTFILIYNDAHGEVKIVATGLDSEAILKDYDIKL